MKAYLYKLKEGWVLCSDEDFKSDDIVLVNNKYHTNELRKFTTAFGGTKEGCKKVLTQSPDLSSLSPDKQKEIGWFDVEELALAEYPVDICDSYDIICHRAGDDMNEQNREHFTKGLKKLTADRVFTEEDIKSAIRYGFDVGFCSNSNNKVKNTLQSEDEFIKSLSQPKSWEVEIETEESKEVESYTPDGTNGGELIWKQQPKIVNGKIKVLKIIK